MVSHEPTLRLLRSRVWSAVGRITRRARRDEAGLGLIEAILAIVILLVVLVPMSLLIATTVQQTSNAKEKVTATELAEEELEQLNNDSLTILDSDLGKDVSQSPVSVAGVTYTVSTFLEWEGVGASPDLCKSGSPPQVMSATATVAWGPGGAERTAEQSVINPPYGLPVFYLASKLTDGSSYSSLTATTPQTIATGETLTIGVTGDTVDQVVVASPGATNSTTIPVVTFTANATYTASPATPVALPGEGYLAVQVDGASGSAPTSFNDVTVTIQSTATGSTPTTYTPDDQGCVYEQELPGGYNVTLGSAAGTSPPFVDRSFNQSPSTSSASCIPALNPCIPQVVQAGSVTLSTWSFDQAASVSFVASASAPAAGGMPVSVSNTKIPLTGTEVLTSSPAYLYPFTSPYTAVYYGDCAAEEPASPSTVTVTPGETGTVVSVTGLGVLTVNVTASSGTFVGTPTATAQVQSSGPSAGCNTNTFTLTQPTGTTSSVSSQSAVPVGQGGVYYQVVVKDCPTSGTCNTVDASPDPVLVTTSGTTVTASIP